MKMKYNIAILLGLIVLITAKKIKYKTEIKISTKENEEKEVEKEIEKEIEKETDLLTDSISDTDINNKNGTSLESEEEEEEKQIIDNEENKEKEKNVENEIQKEKEKEKESEPDTKSIIIPEDKYIKIEAPYQENEDYIITPVGFGSPINFIPLQIETTSYKSWVISSTLNEKSSSLFSYNKISSKTFEDTNEWDTVVDLEGSISGNIIYDKIALDKFVLNRFKFIEAIEFENFNDYKLGKLGLGNCEYADDINKEYCLLYQLKKNGNIIRKIFSLREISDTHGELIIGDISPDSKEKDYPLLKLAEKNIYDNIEGDEFKMSWITKISHLLVHDNNENIKNIFDDNINVEGYVSFDSSCHYIEAPYNYINIFQKKIFDKYFFNFCRKVNEEGVYMFLCNKEKFDEIKNKIKELNLIFVMNGFGFEINLEFLFEETRENDYEFFVHFKDFEQNIWNLGHPFFHFYTIIFDQDNQEIGIDGKNIYFLKEETEKYIKKEKKGYSVFKIFLLVLICVLIFALIFYLMRNFGIQIRKNKGIDPKLIDNESLDDILSLNPNNIH